LLSGMTNSIMPERRKSNQTEGGTHATEVVKSV
jgi:hypothetical protein